MDINIRKSARLIIVDEQGRLLLFNYHDEHQAPFWATVGGELINEESYLEAAERELLEETGLKLNIGILLKERNEIYAVARSVPACWQEKYYLIDCPNNPKLSIDGWSDEEKSTIQKWKWWSLNEMKNVASGTFKPEFLPELLKLVLDDRKTLKLSSG